MDKKKQIGFVEISYNRNSKVVYSRFIPSIDAPVIEDCDIDCLPQEELIKDKVEKSMAAWFAKVSDIETSDAFQREFKVEVEDKRYFSNSDTLRYLKLKVFLI